MNSENAKKRLRTGMLESPRALVVYLAGMVLVYVGERLIGGQGASRFLVSGLGVLAVLGACAEWLAGWKRREAEAARAERLAFLLGIGGLAALAVYAISSDLVMGPSPVTKQQGISIRQILQVAWPVILASSVVPLVFIQASAASMGHGRGVEMRRLVASAVSGMSISLLLATLFFINAIANRLDTYTDLSYFKTTSPSEATKSLVQGLDKPVEALLFFPPANDVLAEIEPYFRELSKLSPKFRFRVVDRAMEPQLAQKWRVTSDGTVVLARGEANQKINIGDNFDRAKRTLSKFDAEFLQKMLKLQHRREVVYMLAGHGERTANYNPSDARPKLTLMKKFLQALNMQVKTLGPTEGLADDVPDDAACVIWADPAGTLLPGEADALKRYLDRGGRMLLLLDTDTRGAANEVLDYLGLEYHPVKLANSRAHVIVENSPADVYNIVTNSFSSHPSVSTVARARAYFPILFPTTGYLEKKKVRHEPKRRIVLTIRTMPQTWADEDGDAQRSPAETSKLFNLAAAVSWKGHAAEKSDAGKKQGAQEGGKEGKSGNEKKEAAEGGKSGKSGKGDEKRGAVADSKTESSKKEATKKPSRVPDVNKLETRVVVFADTDVFADKFIGFRTGYSEVGGNLQLLADTLRWLLDEERVPGVTSTEEDVKIVHTRDEDKAWFYGTVFGIPALVLLAGVGTRWGRGRKRRLA